MSLVVLEQVFTNFRLEKARKLEIFELKLEKFEFETQKFKFETQKSLNFLSLKIQFWVKSSFEFWFQTRKSSNKKY